MKMKGIIFRPDMAKAIRDGRKTQIRIPIENLPVGAKLFADCTDRQGDNVKSYAEFIIEPDNQLFTVDAKYNYSDLLYIKESWRIIYVDHPTQTLTVEYKDRILNYCKIDSKDQLLKYHEQSINQIMKSGRTYWRPARTMPQEVARTFMRCTDVRVERLWDIKLPEDIVAEGAEYLLEGELPKEKRGNSFFSKWNVIYKNQPEYQWEANPWVYVYEFEREEK